MTLELQSKLQEIGDKFLALLEATVTDFVREHDFEEEIDTYLYKSKLVKEKIHDAVDELDVSDRVEEAVRDQLENFDFSETVEEYAKKYNVLADAVDSLVDERMSSNDIEKRVQAKLKEILEREDIPGKVKQLISEQWLEEQLNDYALKVGWGELVLEILKAHKQDFEQLARASVEKYLADVRFDQDLRGRVEGLVEDSLRRRRLREKGWGRWWTWLFTSGK